MNEADTRARLIDPKLKNAGWTENQLTREFYYQRDLQYTEGRVILVGDRVRHGEPRKADYLLRYTEGFPIAVVEAKSDEETAESGLEQVKRYAEDLGVAFAYATNGETIIEYDFFRKVTRELDAFPSPSDLWDRWKRNTGKSGTSDAAESASEFLKRYAQNQKNPLLYPYCPESVCGKKPRYFQEVAVREVIKRVMLDRRRVLLTMATGTGKTFVAFQIAWKLIKSKWLQNLHPDRPARVLFLADRVVLRDQAYNAFSPFSDGSQDPRFAITGHPPNVTRDLYFSLYHSLWSPDEKGVRLFEKYPRDFFDLIIIDECHRSGFGTWKEILNHFESAIHLGMTATPKQDENIDTYAYFNEEEAEVFIDPDDPDKGKWKPPAFQYSLGQGIEDGFLATYKVHRVRTTVDATGLRLQDAIEQGAEVFIPPDVEPKDEYNTPEFERKIVLPDRTKRMVKHLAGLLRKYGIMEKTMVFCVDMDHARLVAELLQNEFGPETGMDRYAVPIISEEGEEGRRLLTQFADSDKKEPVVATTAELLSTGVDVPSCRNIVFMKTLSSPILFKQIIGRGSRIDTATGKFWFRIVDFTGATRLFDKWDRPPGPPPEPPQGPFTSTVEGTVFHVDTNQLIVGASVSIRTGPNAQQGPIRTDGDGHFRFTQLPAGNLTLMVNASGFVPRDVGVFTVADETTTEDVALKPQKKSGGKIKVSGLEVSIADEATFLIEATGEQLTLNQYQDYTRKAIMDAAPSRKTLHDVWVDPDKRAEFLEDLMKSSVHPEVLAEVMATPEADTYDVLAHIAFGDPIRTRTERATAFQNREQSFIDEYKEDARWAILELLEKYRIAGVDEISPDVFGVRPFKEKGGAFTISRWFGGVDALGRVLREIQKRLYPEVD